MALKHKSTGTNLNLEEASHVCPICCIIPPHMTDHILKYGDDKAHQWALNTLRISEQFRGARQTLGFLPQSYLPVGTDTTVAGKNRTIYDLAHGSVLPGNPVRTEGAPPTADVAVNEAYDGAGATYDLFYHIYGRNSLDNNGMPLNSTVHYSSGYDNAFWNGFQMVYGDGDGKIFNRFTIAIDVIAHELSHGVTQFTAALAYQGESGALNESFSDVMGSLVKQRVLNQTVDQADWIMGAGLLAPGIKGVGVRSMKAPGTAYNDPVLGKDPQPALYKNLYKGTDDNGGVHINSGIPNYAFYLAAMAIGGHAWEKTGKIWYYSLTTATNIHATFKDAAAVTIYWAGQFYGQSSLEKAAVTKAWKTVGVI